MEDQLIDELASQVPAAFEERTVLPPGDRFGGYQEGSLEDLGLEPVAREDLGDWVPDDFVLSAPVAPPGWWQGRPGSIDVVAMYVSFHLTRSRWGIYVWEDRLQLFALDLFGSLQGVSDKQRLLRAWDFVLKHEFFHYWFDIAAVHMELAAAAGVYLPHIRQHASGPVAEHEEALSNASAWRILDSAEKAAAEPVLSASPPGYRDWLPVASSFREAKAWLGGRAAENVSARMLPNLPFDWFFADTRVRSPSTRSGSRPGARESLVPLWLIPAPGRGSLFRTAHEHPIQIETTGRFDKELRRSSASVGSHWDAVRLALQQGHWGGAKFGPMAGSRCWRCYVGKAHRAVFRKIDQNRYEAISIFPRGQDYRIDC